MSRERVGGGVKESGPQQLAAFIGAPGAARADATAKKICSGVAGLSKVTRSAVAERGDGVAIASRTEMASINGGSPTALLPNTTPGSVARARKSTLKISGISDHDGSL